MKPDLSFSKVLYIDLTRKTFQVKNQPALFQEYIGGTGVATRLLSDFCPEGTPPDAPENPIVLAIGPLTGLFPLASKTVAMFKSPLTGNLGESHAGGRSAVAIRMAGYGAVVITGKSDFPIYVSIHGDKVHFRDARTLWGMKSCYTVGRIIRLNEPGAGIRSIMRIGRGGENQVSYGSVTTETYRHFGRLGLGAVMGSKNLKAIVVSGQSGIPVENKKAFRKLYDHIYHAAVESPVMKKYHDLGTAGNVLALNKMGALPTRNLSSGTFEKAAQLSGEHLAAHYLGRRLACAHCPVGCIHIAALREPYDDEPYFYKTTMIGYDYELIYSLGSSLGIGDPEGILRLIDAVEKYSIDCMSTGVALAWATEAFQKGLISDKETAGLQLNWGDYQTYIKAVNYIVEQPNQFYQALSKGVDYASKQYGGKEFALAFGKNEMPGYHTGPGAYLGYQLGTRHSHLDSGGYGIDQNMIKENTSLDPKQIMEQVIEEEKWRQILSSLVICFFARGIYTPEVVREALAISGLDLTDKTIADRSKKIYLEKYAFKLREGFTIDGKGLALRIFETKSPSIAFDQKFIDQATIYAHKKIMEDLKS